MKSEPCRRVTLWLVRSLLAAAILFMVTSGAAVAQSTATKSSGQDDKTSADQSARDQAKASRNLDGQRVFVDPATGRLRPPTPEEARALAEVLQRMLDHSPEGLQVVHRPDGTMVVDLQDRFQDVAMASVGPDGKVALACVNDAATAQRLLKGEVVPGIGLAASAARQADAKKADAKKADAKQEDSKKADVKQSESKPAPSAAETE